MKKYKCKLITGIATGLMVCLISFNSEAQSSITIDASQNITNFKFTNSQGERDESYNPNYSGSYSLGYRFTTDFGLFGGIKVGMRNAGASLVYDDANYSWNLQYFDSRLDIGYMYSFDRFSPYLAVSPYFGYLLRATQTLNHQNFDIINSGDLERTDYGLFISPGVDFRVNDLVSVYSQFNYMLGLQNIETVENQESNNTLLGLTLGLAFTIK
ncbi:MAG: outer membrane beta-barrel protein [Brumimicrobium sp.]|nr:outer membrane beta-barrel protein [Brumimicrobium sp.]